MKIITPFIICILRFIYFFIKLRRVRDKITFISRQSDDIPLDFSLLSEKMSELLPEYELIILTKKFRTGLGGMISYFPHMLRQMTHISSSKVVILDTYCIAISILNHKKPLKVIQIWHAMGLLKRTGKSVLGSSEGRDIQIAELMNMHENYDYVCASSPACVSGIAQVFGCDEDKVIVKALPRADYLRDALVVKSVKEQIAMSIPALSGKRNILYAPTHRRSSPELLQEKFEELAKAIDYDRYNLIVSSHPLSQLHLTQEGVYFPNGFSSLELAMYCDAVVIDYSSIMYEIAILGKPQYFYTYDIDEYIIDPGFFIDYINEVPGNKRRVAEDVMKDIDDENYDAAEMQRLLDKYVYLSDEGSTFALARYISGLAQEY
jgi:CDP-ribitol ribitolphosphotransferase